MEDGVTAIMDKTSLGDRMKAYEGVSKMHLLRRTPVIIRVDGKAFHTFTKMITEQNDPSSSYGPSEKFHTCMMDTAFVLCSRIQNCVMAYTQSDDISLLLKDWTKIETDQWFGGNVQKIASVSASIATAYFNYAWDAQFPEVSADLALFDARVFNIPKEDVVNYFIWRQQDATRNSINFIGRKHFSHKQMHGKSTSEIQEMLFHEHDCNWNDYATWKRRGSCVIKKDTYNTGNFVPESFWIKDETIPIFTQEREYIGDLL